jgi:hypothetical protein
MYVCVSLSLLCKACAHVYASHTPTYLPSDDQRERERDFSLGVIEFCKTGINQINYFYSCGCVCVVCLWRENDSFRALLAFVLFFSFLSYLKKKKKISTTFPLTYSAELD